MIANKAIAAVMQASKTASVVATVPSPSASGELASISAAKSAADCETKRRAMPQVSHALSANAIGAKARTAHSLTPKQRTGSAISQ